MLTGRKLLFVGGDARMLEVIAKATELDASVTLVGFDDEAASFPDTSLEPLSVEAFADVDALVLPIAGTDESGRVESRFCDQPIVLTDAHFAAMREGALVFCGIAGAWLQRVCDTHKLQLIRLMALDEVAILNSIPTAEGAIAMAMERTAITVHGSNCTVLGFGRCGQTLARTLSALGARVCVVARGEAHLARVREMALTPLPMAQLARAVGTADIVFNTIPHPILTANVLCGVQRSVVIIDIASKPGGTDFRYASRHNITAVLAPSLPGLVAPQTAGRIIAGSLCRILAQSNPAKEG